MGFRLLLFLQIYVYSMTFCPEWLTGSLNLNTSNALDLWVYLLFGFLSLIADIFINILC